MGEESAVGAGAGEPAEERLREMVELLERVRHEMNNPLAGILGQAQLLLRDEALDTQARRRVQAIETLAQRLRDTVAELSVVQTARGPATAAAHAEPPQTCTKTDDPPRH